LASPPAPGTVPVPVLGDPELPLLSSAVIVDETNCAERTQSGKQAAC